MAIATIFQRFDLVMDDPSYQLREKQTVTLKPDGFYIRAYPRNRKARLYTTPSPAKLLQGNTKQKPTLAALVDTANSQPLYVLYGSNSGTSESFAQRVASDAPAHGFRPSIGTLDSAAENIPSNGPVVIITASFEGLSCYSWGWFNGALIGSQVNLPTMRLTSSSGWAAYKVNLYQTSNTRYLVAGIVIGSRHINGSQGWWMNS